MLLLSSLLALGLAQLPCRWKEESGKLQLNGVEIFNLETLFLFVGKGKLDITDFRGTFWVDDYTGKCLLRFDVQSKLKVSPFFFLNGFQGIELI